MTKIILSASYCLITDSPFTITDLQIPNSSDINVCVRCGRKLRKDSSLMLHMGPCCFRQYKKEQNRCKKLF